MSVEDGIVFRAFRPEDATAFRLLNEAWIVKHFALEAKDRATLGDPQRFIIETGGHIFVAALEDQVVGCCALQPHEPDVPEAAKMTIAESMRGRGLGRRLLAYTLEQARALGATGVYLETNQGLKDAIHLYEALGFKHLPADRVVASPYARANVFMELRF